MNSIEQLEALKKQVIELQEKLNKLTWNQDKWEPKGGDWFINIYGNAENYQSEEKTKSFGTERETKELAEKAAIEMRKFNRLLAYHDEFCPDFEFIVSHENYYIYFNEDDKKWGTYRDYSYKHIQVYFPENTAIELVKKLNSGEVEL